MRRSDVKPNNAPIAARNWALFLDFDGTLTEIAPTPAQVAVDPALPATLKALHEALGGALALISGRPVSELDALLGMTLPAAGVHGLERRLPGHEIWFEPVDKSSLAHVRARLEAFAATDLRLFLEEKHGALALHFRQAPELEIACYNHIEAALRDAPGIRLVAGKMVLEARSAAANKGHAIEAFMAAPPFRGRVPVFIGDDLTDEDGFAAVNKMKGVSLKIGSGETVAQYRLGGVADLLGWLKEAAARLGAVRAWKT